MPDSTDINGAPRPAAPPRATDHGDVFRPRPSAQFVVTDPVERVTRRALAYLDAGYPVHLTGPAGTGKTSLAFHIAAEWGRPAVLLHGDDEFARSDLIGGEVGYRKSKVVDNFIRSVLKTSEQVVPMYADNRLAKACREGYTLIYDEFTRSRPEANNVLLSILEERILNLPTRGSEQGYLRVHPRFRALFTSNTEEYAGTHKTQNALLDRLVSIRLDFHDRATEVAIATARSGLDEDDAARLVDLVRAVRGLDAATHGPSVRAALTLARVFARQDVPLDADDPFVRDVCLDVLRPPHTAPPDATRHHRARVEALLRKHLR